MGKEMLEHAEKVLNDFCDEMLNIDPDDIQVAYTDLDPFTTEEKLVKASDDWPQNSSIATLPYEISELVQGVLERLPDFADPEASQVAFDVLYESFSKVMNGR